MYKRCLSVFLACILCLFALPESGSAAKRVRGIKLSPATLELAIGEFEQLTVQWKPANAAGKCKWKSSNPRVATVDADGLVSAVGKGRAVISAKTKNGKTAKCKVTVLDPSMVVALTFDDGPNQNTADILKVLRKNDIKATFFMLGMQAEKFPDIAKQVADAGCEIGNHTMGHKSLRLLTQDEAIAELKQGADAIEAACLQAPTVIRAPYGNIPDGLPEAMQATFAQWSVDPEDWKSRNAASVYRAVLDAVKPGSIILLHDIYSSTATALEKLVPELKRQGYRFLTISELLAHRGITEPAGQIVY